MKVITANFITCAVKSCRSSQISLPLHFRDAELENQEIDYSPQFIQNILPRLNWENLRTTAAEVRFLDWNPFNPTPGTLLLLL